MKSALKREAQKRRVKHFQKTVPLSLAVDGYRNQSFLNFLLSHLHPQGKKVTFEKIERSLFLSHTPHKNWCLLFYAHLSTSFKKTLK